MDVDGQNRHQHLISVVLTKSMWPVLQHTVKKKRIKNNFEVMMTTLEHKTLESDSFPLDDKS